MVRYRDDNDNNTVEGYLDKSVHNLSVTYETHDDFTISTEREKDSLVLVYKDTRMICAKFDIKYTRYSLVVITDNSL